MTSVAHLFPLTVTLSKKLINNSLPLNNQLCQGALALRQALGTFANGRRIVWGVYCGMVDDLTITTTEKVMMPCIFSPVEVTFVVADRNLIDNKGE